MTISPSNATCDDDEDDSGVAEGEVVAFPAVFPVAFPVPVLLPQAYLSLFPAVDAAFAVLYYLVLMVGIIIVILTLGYEWKELADSLEFGDSGLLLVLPDKTNGQIQLSETKPELLTGSSEERKAD